MNVLTSHKRNSLTMIRMALRKAMNLIISGICMAIRIIILTEWSLTLVRSRTKRPRSMGIDLKCSKINSGHGAILIVGSQLKVYYCEEK